MVALFARGVGVTGGAGGDALCAALHAGDCGGWALFARGVGGDAVYATLYAGGCDGRLCLLEALEVLEVLDVMRRVLLFMLEAVQGEFCLLEVLTVIRCMLLR